MEKIKREVEIDRYEIRVSNYFESFTEVMGYCDYDKLKIVYNEAGTQSVKVFENSLGSCVEKDSFKEIEDIKKYSKNLGLKHWTVVSFYQENGYIGVYTNQSDEALRVKCNNWIGYGGDGFKFVFFADSQSELDKAINALRIYFGVGIQEYSVYDNLEEEFIEHFYDLGSYDDIKECLEPYGFDEKWYTNVKW